MSENLDIEISERGAREVQRNIAGIGSAARGAAGPVRALQNLLAAYISLEGIRNLAKVADSYTEMENRIRVLDNISGHYTTTMARLLSISNETRSSLRDNVMLFQRMGLAQKELNASTNELFQVTRAVGQAIAIQGGLATTSAGAVLQLSQAFGSGRVQLEEFNSVITGLYPIAKAAAEGIDIAGGSIAKLRRLIADGEINSQMLFNGILKSVSALDSQFAKTVPTVSQSFTVLNNVFTYFVGELNKSLNASVAFSQMLLSIAANFDTVVNSAVVLAFTLGPALLLGAISKLYLAISTLALANPFIFAVSAVAGLLAYFVLFNDELDDLTKNVYAGATAFDRLAATAAGTKAYIQAAWENFPTWFGNLFTEAVDKAVTALSTFGSGLSEGVGAEAEQGKKILDFFGLTPKYAEDAIKTWEKIKPNLEKNLNFDLPPGVIERQGNYGTVAGEAFNEAYANSLKEAKKRRDEILAGDANARPNGGNNPDVDEKGLRKLTRELDRLLRQIDPAEAAWREFVKAQETLDKALNAGLITFDQYNSLVEAAQRQFGKAIFPVREFISENERLIEVLGQTADEQERLEAIHALELDMRRKLTDAERQQVEVSLQRLKAARTESEILRSINGPREEYLRSTEAQLELLAKGAINQDQYMRSRYETELAYLQAYPSIANEYRAAVLQVEEQQRQLGVALQNNVISMEQFRAGMAQTAIEMANISLTTGEGDVGDIFTGSLDKLYDGFKSTAESLKDILGDLWKSLGDGVANSIGQALVYAENLGSALKDVARSAVAQLIASLVKLGIQWVIMGTLGSGLAVASATTSMTLAAASATAWAPAAALASLATLGTNAMPAQLALASTVALSNILAGGIGAAAGGVGGGAAMGSTSGMSGSWGAVAQFQDGGWTGSAGTGEVAGLVHGQEFVTNAEATAKYRPVLEAMNDGKDLAGMGGGFNGNIIIINETGVQMEAEARYTTAGDVELIARRVTREESPRAVAQDMENPTGPVRRSLSRNTDVRNKRNGND